MNAITLREAKKELKQKPKEIEKVKREYTTGAGELIGDIYINRPNTHIYKKGMYKANILLSKTEGKRLTKELNELLQEHYKKYGEGTELIEINRILEPYKDDIKGRYILRTQKPSQIYEGEDIGKPQIIVKNKELQSGMLKGWGFSIKQGNIVKLLVRFETQITSQSMAIISVLKGVEIIKPEIYKFKITEGTPL